MESKEEPLDLAEDTICRETRCDWRAFRFIGHI